MRENNIDWYYIYSKIHIYTYERGNEREVLTPFTKTVMAWVA